MTARASLFVVLIAGLWSSSQAGKVFTRTAMHSADISLSSADTDSYRTRALCAYGCLQHGEDQCRAFSWVQDTETCQAATVTNACAKAMGAREAELAVDAEEGMHLAMDEYETKTVRVAAAVKAADQVTSQYHTLDASTDLPSACSSAQLLDVPNMPEANEFYVSNFDGGFLACTPQGNCWSWMPGQTAWQADAPGTTYYHRLNSFYGLVTFLGEGAVMVAGDTDEANTTPDSEYSVEILEAGASAWTTVKPMPIPQKSMALVSTDSNTVFTIGGVETGGGGIHNRVFKYDRLADTWEEKDSVPSAVSNSGSLYEHAQCGRVIRSSNPVIVCLGALNTDKIAYFDLQSETWHDTGATSTASSVPHRLTKPIISGNKIWRFGGKDYSTFASSNDVTAYDPGTDIVTEQASSLAEASNVMLGVLQVEVIVAK